MKKKNYREVQDFDWKRIISGNMLKCVFFSFRFLVIWLESLKMSIILPLTCTFFKKKNTDRDRNQTNNSLSKLEHCTNQPIYSSFFTTSPTSNLLSRYNWYNSHDEDFLILSILFLIKDFLIYSFFILFFFVWIWEKNSQINRIAMYLKEGAWRRDASVKRS